MSDQSNLPPEFCINNLEHFFDVLISVDVDLKTRYNAYLQEEYGDKLPPFEVIEGKVSEDEDWSDSRLQYLEIAEIARYIVDKYQSKQTQVFHAFFYNVEEILCKCDDYVEELIVTGLLEGIQNIGGDRVDYHCGYNQWLPPIVQLKWDGLIDLWEGIGWRKRK